MKPAKRGDGGGINSTICTSYVPVGELQKCTNYSIIAAITATI